MRLLVGVTCKALSEWDCNNTKREHGLRNTNHGPLTIYFYSTLKLQSLENKSTTSLVSVYVKERHNPFKI